MTAFTKQTYEVFGIKTEVLEAGAGEPLVFFHQAGTAAGFDALLPLAEGRRLIIPFHPGFGGSEDDPQIDSVLDYVVHYDALFDQMGIDEPIDLIGHSLGGWIASLMAIFGGSRIKRLALACPVGLRVQGHPTIDLFTVPPAETMNVMFARPPAIERPNSGPAFIEMTLSRVREMTSLARFAWFRPYEPKLDRWLERVRCPTLLLWGEMDHVTPIAQMDRWAERLGGTVTLARFPETGHMFFRETPSTVETLQEFFAR